MIPKQQEMDAIVEEIDTAMRQQKHLDSTLLILCGDHGMNEAGNHGGSSAGETSPALTFISPKFEGRIAPNKSPVDASSEFHYYRTVEQSDLTPTLAGLLGVPIPRNNLGVIIREILDLWQSGKQRHSRNLGWANAIDSNAVRVQTPTDLRSSSRTPDKYLKSSRQPFQNIRLTLICLL